MKRTSKLIFTALAATMPLLGYSDIIVFTDGTRLEGRAEQAANNKERIAFTSGNGRMELPRERIREVIDESDSQDWTHVGNQFLTAKNYSAAVQMFQKALEANAQFAPAKEGLEAAQAAIGAQQGDRVLKMQEAIGQQLEQITTMLEKDTYDEERYRKAESELNQILDSDDSSDQQKVTAQRLLRDLFGKWGFARMDRLDRQGAEEKYLRVLEMDPNNVEAREALLKIWRDDPAKKPQVLEAYLAKLKEEPNNLEYNRIAGELLYETERYAEAIPMLQKVAASPKYTNRGFDKMLSNAYKGAIMEARDTGDTERAIALTESQIQVFPGTDTTNLTVLRYELAKSKLAPDDWAGRGQLVGKLQEVGLTQMAEREAELILRYDPANEAATSVLRTQALGELQEVQLAMQQGQYSVARSMASQFMTDNSRFPDLIQQAQELYNVADIEAKKQAEANRERAEQIGQRGIQYLQEAQRATAELTSDNRRSDSSNVYSYKQEAITKSKRAIDHMQEALRIDPSLGGMDGMDLNNRLRDAQNLYNSLTDSPTSLPRVRNR